MAGFDINNPQAHVMMGMAAQWYAQSTGNVPAQFMPQQGFSDQLRAMEQQRQLSAAMQATAAAEAHNWGKLVAPFMPQGPNRDAHLATIERDFRAAAPFIVQAGSQMGFRPIISAMGGEHGSTMLAGNDIYQANMSSRDPATGRIGYSGTSAGRIAEQVSSTLYGPGSDGAMRGVAIDEASQFMFAERNRGGGPRAIRSVISDAELGRIKTMKEGGGAFDVRNALSKETQSAMDPAEINALQLAGGSNMDEMLRGVDSLRTSNFFKKSADLIRAFKDVFGPNSDMHQATQVMQALTQGNAQGLDHTQLAHQLQLTKELATSSGMGMEKFMQFSGNLGNYAASNGLDRRGVMQAAQGAAAYQSAFKDSGYGSLPALDGQMDKLSMMHAQLQMQGGNSPVAGQMGATLAVGESIGGFKAGSEAERIHAAIKAGQSTYDGGKSVYKDETEWQRIMSEGGADAGMARDARSNHGSNVKRAIDAGADGAIRDMQFNNDIRPRMAAAMAGSFGRSAAMVGKSEDENLTLANAAISGIMEMDMSVYAGDPEARRKALAKKLKGSKAAAGLSDAELENLAGNAVLSFDGTSNATGWEDGTTVKALFDKKMLSGTKEAKIRSDLMSQFAGAVSGIGTEDPLRRVFQVIMDAGKDAPIEDMVAKIFNVQSGKAIQDAIAPHREKIEQERAAYEDMLKDPTKVQGGKLTEEGKKALDEHVAKMDEITKEMKKDVDAAAAAEVKKPSKGQADAQGGGGKDLASGGPERLEIHGTLNLGGDSFPLTGEAYRPAYTPIA